MAAVLPPMALGHYPLLLVNLAGSAVPYARFLAERSSFALLERWPTADLPAHAGWAWMVTALLPVRFAYQ